MELGVRQRQVEAILGPRGMCKTNDITAPSLASNSIFSQFLIHPQMLMRKKEKTIWRIMKRKKNMGSKRKMWRTKI